MIIRNILLGLVLILLISNAAYADTPPEKLGRGAANVGTGWLEVPAQITKTSESDGAIAGMTVGLVTGVVYGVRRTFMGVYEVVTFLAPTPQEYKELIEPDFVVSDTDGAYKGF
jgi:putative exosortase-associated protein (TIGR04073 family)